MNSSRLYWLSLFGGVAVWLILGSLQITAAQQTDTSQTTQERELKQREAPQPYHSERSANQFLLPEGGSYGVPEPTEYYQPPFTGQESLDRAVAAYREELENSIANTPLFQFLGKIAPFITNQFEFGYYQIYDLPIADRDNPHIHSNETKQ